LARGHDCAVVVDQSQRVAGLKHEGISLEEMVSEMVRDDLRAAEKDQLCIREGYQTFQYYE